MTRFHPRPTLFPYTTLFRSRQNAICNDLAEIDLNQGRGNRLEYMVLRKCEIDAHQDERHRKAHDQQADWLRQRQEFVRSEEHTLNSSHANISYAVFCLKKKN